MASQESTHEPRSVDAARPVRNDAARSTRLRLLWQIIVKTVGSCMRYRVMGLAGEAAFFAILSLPPLVFGLVGAVGLIARELNVATVLNLKAQIIVLASQALSTSSVQELIEPTLNDVLTGGRFSIISIGFIIALWSGSRALNVFVDTITIMYGLGGRRGIVRTRALSFTLYLVFLVLGSILLPLVLAGPGVVKLLLPAPVEFLGSLYWPIVLLLSVFILATLYHLSSPVRTPWRTDLPGGTLALAIWVGGSVLLRLVLNKSAASTTIYGPLAAPIALLMWLYVISLAILIGAGFNQSISQVFPDMLAGAKHKMKARQLRRGRFQRPRFLRRRVPYPKPDIAPGASVHDTDLNLNK